MIPEMSDAQATVIAALLAAGLAAIGYVSKLGIDSFRAAIDRRDARYATLVELDCLLRASHAVFENQNGLAVRLDAEIAQAQPDLVIPQPAGFENTFAAAYKGLADGQRTMLGVIRSLTEHAMKPLNDRMLEWLLQDTYWKAQRTRGGAHRKLAISLAKLEAHLYLWHAKYDYWMRNPVHSLVYLADEESHGVKFPEGIDALVHSTIERKG